MSVNFNNIEVKIVYIKNSNVCFSVNECVLTCLWGLSANANVDIQRHLLVALPSPYTVTWSVGNCDINTAVFQVCNDAFVISICKCTLTSIENWNVIICPVLFVHHLCFNVKYWGYVVAYLLWPHLGDVKQE